MPLLRNIVRHVGDLVLTTDSDQRLRISRSLMAALLYAGCLSIIFICTLLGLADPVVACYGGIYIAAGPVAFYVLLRSGWNRRMRDPALSFPQMLFASSALMIAYSNGSQVRSAVLLVLVQIVIFGMFSMTPVQSRWLTAFMVGGFGLTMASLAAWRPEINDPRAEVINFVTLTAVLLVVTTLSSQFSRLRARLRQQRGELRAAYTRLENLVRLDELTGLVNRRRMHEVLDEEALRRQRDPRPTCLCAIDIDHFKRINDNHGHAAGDEVLKRFARVASGCLRQIDVLGRWGGEEFLLLLPQTDAAAAAPVIERLRAALADAAHWHDAPQWRVTFSAGVTLWHLGEPPEPAIERADQAAYRAKATGRDRWCVG